MARPTQADMLGRWRHRVAISRRWRQKEGYDDLWDRLVDLYRGKHFDGTSTEDQIAINIAFSTINVIYPSVSVNYPKTTVWARKPEDDDRATITEAVIDYWWRHFDFREPFRRAVKDYLTVGHGWVKVGYKYAERDVPLEGKELEAEMAKRMSELDEFAGLNPHMAHELPSADEVAAGVYTSATKTVVDEDRPFVERVSFKDIFVDPEATCLEDAKWIAQRIVRPLADVRRDGRYEAGARKKVTADRSVNTQWRDPRDERRMGDDVARVTVFEVYDLQTGSMFVMADTCEQFLVKPQRMPYACGHPFVMIRNYDVPDHFYPMGDLEALECLQYELNKTRSQMMNHRKRYARKFLARASQLSPEAMEALRSEHDGEIVPIEDDSLPLADVIAEVPMSHLPADFYNQSEMIEQDINTVSGVNEYARGSMPEIRRTATEASIIADASNARAADKLAVIEGAVAKISRNLVSLAQQYLTGEHVARVVGKNGLPVWVPYDRDDVSGEFDFEVEAGSTQPMNDSFRVQRAMELLNALMPLATPMAPGMPPLINPQELVRYVLQEGFKIKDPERFLSAPPDQMAMDPMAAMGGAPPEAGGLPPELAGAPPGPADPMGMADAVPPEILMQLEQQVGYVPNTLLRSV